MYFIYSPNWHTLQVGTEGPSYTSIEEGIHVGCSAGDSENGREFSPTLPWIRILGNSLDNEGKSIAYRVRMGPERAKRLFAILDILSRGLQKMASSPCGGKMWGAFMRMTFLSLSITRCSSAPSFYRNIDTSRPSSNDNQMPTTESPSKKIFDELNRSALQRRLWRERNFGYTGRAIMLKGEESFVLVPLGGRQGDSDDGASFLIEAAANRLRLLMADTSTRDIDPAMNCPNYFVYLVPSRAAAALYRVKPTRESPDALSEKSYRIIPWDGRKPPACNPRHSREEE